MVFTELLEHLRAQPGILSVAQVNMTPISGSGWNEGVRPDSFTGDFQKLLLQSLRARLLEDHGNRSSCAAAISTLAILWARPRSRW